MTALGCACAAITIVSVGLLAREWAENYEQSQKHDVSKGARYIA
jgi:hypothetical protein